MKILKFMTEATGRIDTNELAHRVGITSKQLIEQVQEMTKAGFLRRVGGGYAITEKGKNALKATAPVPADARFNFYVGLDQPADVSAGSVEEFYGAVQKVDAASLEFHLYRGDFENWFRLTIKDEKFAEQLATIKEANLRGEDLRKTITEAVKSRYSL